MTMRRPRFSIAELLIVVLIIAIDCAALRVALRSDEPRWILMGLGAAPMGALLAIGLLIQARQVRCRDWVSPALIGFEVLGGLALLNFTASSLVLPKAVAEGTDPTLDSITWILGEWGLGPYPADSIIEYTRAIVLFLLPQLLFAAFSAWFHASLPDSALGAAQCSDNHPIRDS
jgi:hypothetical protein